MHLEEKAPKERTRERNCWEWAETQLRCKTTIYFVCIYIYIYIYVYSSAGSGVRTANRYLPYADYDDLSNTLTLVLESKRFDNRYFAMAAVVAGNPPGR